MCISQSPASLIRMNVTKTKGDALMAICWRRECGRLCTLLHTTVKFHISLTLKIMEPERIFNFTDIKRCANCVAGSAAMTLIRSSHRAISSALVCCCWRVRWSQSQSGRNGEREREKKKTAKVHDATLLPPTLLRAVRLADVTDHVRWWSTLIPGWESAEGESRPETHFFNPGRPLPPCSGR